MTKEQQALQILIQAAELAPLAKQAHVLVENAAKILSEFLSLKTGEILTDEQK